MMNESAIRDRIMSLLADHGGKVPHEPAKDFNYLQKGGLDSFELLSFITDIETTFAVQITPEELTSSDSHTVDGLVRLIAGKRSNSG